jgi:hypothetical protein
MAQDPYDVLGVQRGASPGQIDEAYRSRFNAVSTGSVDGTGQGPTYTLAELTEAYTMLSDTVTRSKVEAPQSLLAGSATPSRPRLPTECQNCGCSPVHEGALHRQTGMILMRRHFRRSVTACRDCGLSIARKWQNQTLLQGWWGLISFFVNFYYVAANAATIHSFARLAKPIPPTEAVVPPVAAPQSPGRSVWLRPGVLVTGLAVAVASLISYAQVNSHNELASSHQWKVGKCVAVSTNEITGFTACGGTSEIVIVGIVSQKANCPKFTSSYFKETASVDPQPSWFVCLLK